MKNNVLLVNLNCKYSFEEFLKNDFTYNPALGISSISEYLMINGFNAYVKDFNYEKLDLDEICSLIEEKNITVVGVCCYTENLNQMFRFFRTLKHFNKNIITFAGGPHATLKPDEVIKSKAVDYAIRNEGEMTLLELLSHIEYGDELLSIDKIDGLTYKKENKIFHNKFRPYIKLLDSLPVINREHHNINAFKHTVSLYSSKGCPAKCIYCSATAISGSAYRTRNVDNIILEALLAKYQIGERFKKIYITDDTFTVNTKRVKRFCQLMKKYKYDFMWGCESRADVMTEELLDDMCTSNLYSLQFGVESGNQEVVDNIQKSMNLKHLESLIYFMRNYDVGVFTSFIVGHYCDTKETVDQTIKFAKHLCTINSNVGYGFAINTPFPGTYQYENAKELDIEIIDNDYSHYDLTTPVLNTKFLSATELSDLFIKANSSKEN